MIEAGTHLGPYEIVSAIGAGGMGEVYKARDTRLERQWRSDEPVGESLSLQKFHDKGPSPLEQTLRYGIEITSARERRIGRESSTVT